MPEENEKGLRLYERAKARYLINAAPEGSYLTAFLSHK